MPEELNRLFERVPSLGIIAENGCFVRQHGKEEWTCFADDEKMAAWKRDVKDSLKYYQERMDGSRLEERYCSLIFHYDDATDKESASRLAGDCANFINDSCEGQRVRAIPTEKAVIIEPIDWSKGSAATHIFESLRESSMREGGGKMPDFLFVAGDDREDEVIFRWANGLAKDQVVKHVTTVTVGKRNTEAMTTLSQGTSGTLTLLQREKKKISR